jgi:hypothetical protein
MLDKDGKPFNRTYPRRADNLVRKGRANWVNGSTIEIIPPAPFQETEDTQKMEGKPYTPIAVVLESMEALVEKALNDSVTLKAIDAIQQCSVPEEEKLNVIKSLADKAQDQRIEILNSLERIVRCIYNRDNKQTT